MPKDLDPVRPNASGLALGPSFISRLIPLLEHSQLLELTEKADSPGSDSISKSLLAFQAKLIPPFSQATLSK